MVGKLRNIEKRGDNDDVPEYEDIAIYDIILPDGSRDGYAEDEVVNVRLIERWPEK